MAVGKRELIERISKNLDIPPGTTEKVIDQLLEEIKTIHKNDEKLQLMHFGTFKNVTHKAKKAYNIGKGEPVMTPERKVLTFKMRF